MIRYGRVVDTDPSKARVKVFFEEDDFTTDWIQILSQGTKDDKFFRVYDKGEAVTCLMDEHADTGVVLGAHYSEKDGTNSDTSGENVTGVKFKDGTTVKYDRDGHRLDVKMGELEFALDKTKGFTIKAGGQSLKEQLNQLLTQLQAETHPTPLGPTGVPINAPVYAQIQQLINLIFEA